MTPSPRHPLWQFLAVDTVITAGVLLILALGLGLLAFEWICHSLGIGMGEYHDFLRSSQLMPFVIAMYFGLVRLVVHPAINSKYMNWLKNTPWSSEQPLPFGQVGPQLLEVIAVVALGMIWQSPGVLTVKHALLGYALGYGGSVAMLCCCSDRFKLAYIMALVLGLMVRVSPSLPLLIVVFVVTMGLVIVCHRSVLAGFPWEDWTKHKEKSALTTDRLGFPYSGLSPIFPWMIQLTSLQLVAVAVLLCWWSHVVSILFQDSINTTDGIRQVNGTIILMFLTGPFWLLVMMTRFLQFRSRLQPPWSILTRLLTGRLIIPRYDVAFVGLLLACVLIVFHTAMLLSVISIPHHWYAVYGAPVLFGVIVFCIYGVGPSLEKWLMTAPGRLPVNSIFSPKTSSAKSSP